MHGLISPPVSHQPPLTEATEGKCLLIFWVLAEFGFDLDRWLLFSGLFHIFDTVALILIGDEVDVYFDRDSPEAGDDFFLAD